VVAAKRSTVAEVILVVEDDDRTRKLIRDILGFHGFRILEATTGELGVEIARREIPQLILMDIRLPGIDGIEALEQLRADVLTASIPVIAVTASVMQGDEHRFRNAGFDGVISKPLDIATFPGEVRSYLS
jgi:two-component system cell cycle response regulator DivK